MTTSLSFSENTSAARSQADVALLERSETVFSNAAAGIEVAQARVMAERARSQHMAELGDAVWKRLGGLLTVVSAWRAARRTERELGALDVRLLSDIGLEPADIHDAARGISRGAIATGTRRLRPISGGLTVAPTTFGAANDAGHVRAA